MSREWTEKDDAYLKANRNDKTFKELARDLGRTPRAVEFRALAMKLVKVPPKPWTERDDALMRELNSQGVSDLEIARRLGWCRQTVTKWRKRAGLPCNRFNDRHRSILRDVAEQQCQGKGVSTLAEMRVLAWQKQAVERGWPAIINGRPTNFRHVQILDSLYERGPQTREQIAASIGCDMSMKRRSLLQGRSYLAGLVREGLVVTLGRVRTDRGRGSSAELYALALDVERKEC